MSKIVEFGYSMGEPIDLNILDSVEDKVLFRYEEDISGMIVNGIDAGEQDFLEECRNEIMDEIKRRYFERESSINNRIDTNLIANLDTKTQDNIGVLKKIKEVSLLPNTELMTTKMVSEWFEIEIKTLTKCVQRNRAELINSGMVYKKHNELKEITGEKYYDLDISRNGSNLFSLECLFLLSFYFKKSAIARQVREEIMKHPLLKIKYKDKFINVHKGLNKENYLYEVIIETFDGIYEIERTVKCERYYIDFVISNSERKIAIECDEYGHINYDQKSEIERESCLINKGYRILRFNPDESNSNVYNFINLILKELV